MTWKDSLEEISLLAVPSSKLCLLRFLRTAPQSSLYVFSSLPPSLFSFHQHVWSAFQEPAVVRHGYAVHNNAEPDVCPQAVQDLVGGGPRWQKEWCSLDSGFTVGLWELGRKLCTRTMSLDMLFREKLECQGTSRARSRRLAVSVSHKCLSKG